MKLLTTFVLFLLTTIVVCSSTILASTKPKQTPATFRAIFASCNKHDHSQEYWKNLVPKAIGDEFTRSKSQNFLDTIVWLGDIIYADYQITPVLPFFETVNESEMEHRWNFFKQTQGYQYALSQIKKNSRVIGTRDDHEGKNDEGKESPTKELTQRHLLDFLDVPKAEASLEAKVRRNQRKGLYSFTRFPLNNAQITEQNKNQMNVCFVLLDGRTHRDPTRGDGKGDMLGEEQWKWLEQVLKTGRDPDFEKANDPSIKTIDDACVVTFIGSGTLVIADSGPFEGFGEFPDARDRLLRLLRTSGSRKYILLSGDIHSSEINVLRANKLPRKTLSDGSLEPEQPYHVCGESPFEELDLYEITSSGTTHHIHPALDNKDRLEWLLPSHRRVNGFYTKENAGVIQIDCPNPSDPRSCNIGVSVVALPDAKQEVQRVNINFELDSAEVLRNKAAHGELEVSVCEVVNDPNHYHLPTYFAPWTSAIMWWKQNIPIFEEEGRLVVMFAQLWTVLILIVVFVSSLLCCACRCGGKRGNKTKRD